jgi:hypothetical protein
MAHQAGYIQVGLGLVAREGSPTDLKECIFVQGRYRNPQLSARLEHAGKAHHLSMWRQRMVRDPLHASELNKKILAVPMKSGAEAFDLWRC